MTRKILALAACLSTASAQAVPLLNLPSPVTITGSTFDAASNPKVPIAFVCATITVDDSFAEVACSDHMGNFSSTVLARIGLSTIRIDAADTLPIGAARGSSSIVPRSRQETLDVALLPIGGMAGVGPNEFESKNLGDR